jgi:hypothetical protein
VSITAQTRRVVLERDGWSCVSCGRYLNLYDYSVHHRVPRGMGGSKVPWIDLPANLLCLCGSGTTGCHGWVERNRTQAYAWGYLVERFRGEYRAPEHVKVLTYPLGWMLYDNDGSVASWPLPNWTADRALEHERYVRDAREIRLGVRAA